ncbi:MAG TPA: hypothetical protein VGQ08_03460 [Nitrospiraceae bacterium]|nr:hypothetical protein [Nitrospiraceae bacterium]
MKELAAELRVSPKSIQRAYRKEEIPVRRKKKGRESFLIARHDEMPALPVSRHAAS